MTPIFSASYSGLFKLFFDVIERGGFAGKPVLIAATGGTARHSLALEHAVRPLFAYLNASTVPTAVYAATEDWGEGALAADGRLVDRIDRAARSSRPPSPHGRRGRRAIRSRTPCRSRTCSARDSRVRPGRSGQDQSTEASGTGSVTPFRTVGVAGPASTSPASASVSVVAKISPPEACAATRAATWTPFPL